MVTVPAAGQVRRQLVRRQDLLEIVRYALTAPTTHNTVPERFRLRPEAGRLDVVLDRTAVLPASDPDGRQATISAGCALAAADVAGRALGWVCRIEVPEDRDPDVTPLTGRTGTTALCDIGTLVLAGRSKTSDPAPLAALRSRRVVRCEYDRSPLDPATEKLLRQVVTEVDRRLEVHLLTSDTDRHAFAKYQEDAERTVLERPEFVRELGDWLLPNEDTTTPVGMRGGELGFDSVVTRRLREGLLGTGPLLADEVAGLAIAARVAVKSSSAVVVIAAPDDTCVLRVAAGRAYLLAALALQAHGLATAMHAAVPEVRRVGRVVAATLLHTRRRPLVVFRTGRPFRADDHRRIRSTRPEPATVLVD